MTLRKEKQKQRMAASERERRVSLLLERGWIRDAAEISLDAIPVDPERINLGGSYFRPICFRDQAFVCRDCGTACTWAAESQRWYFETFSAPYYEQPVRCRACRRKERERVRQARITAGHGQNPLEDHKS
jgi:hypothetical protein